MRNIFLAPIVLLFVVFATSFSLAQDRASTRAVDLELTVDQWRADLRHFAAELPRRHKNAFHSVTRPTFEAAVKRLDDKLPTLKGDEILVEFLRLIAMIGDGHTSIEEHSLFSFGLYPIRYHVYPDGLYVNSAAEEHADLVGAKVVRIGNLPIDEVLSRLKDVAWGDSHNEQSSKVETVFLLMIPKVLQGLKISDTDEAVTIMGELGGRQKTWQIKAAKDPASFMRTTKLVAAYREARNPLPLYLKDERNAYWFDYQKDRELVYVQMNAVQNKPDESVAAFFERVFELVESNQTEKLVLDLRGNTGGNNGLNTPIVTGLIKSKLNKRGHLFVITGRRTFSAAQNLVNEIEKYTNAILVGEPTGSSPNMYGDPVILTLPNSKLPFRIATVWHQIDPGDRRINTAPEIYAEVTPRDFANNVDPALDAVLNYIPGSSFKDIVAEAATGDLASFIKKYRAFKSNPVNKFVNTESAINALGYRLLQSKRPADAVEVLRLNVEAYPRSANVYDSLGEALAQMGKRAEAIKNYETVLTIDPNSQSAADALRRLKSK